jgi:hypothetical protein
MPTADQYRQAADRFRARGEQFQRSAALVSGWRLAAHVDAAPIADPLGVHLAAAASLLGAAADEMGALARICCGRAVICDEHRRRLDRWAALPVWERVVMPRPSRPYPWVSA